MTLIDELSRELELRAFAVCGSAEAILEAIDENTGITLADVALILRKRLTDLHIARKAVDDAIAASREVLK